MASLANTWDVRVQQRMAEAQFMLGEAYYSGAGVPQDYSEATKWYRLAARSYNAAAQCNLGEAYLNGLGVAKDCVQAYAWYDLSANSPKAPKNAAASRDRLANEMTPEQRHEALL